MLPIYILEVLKKYSDQKHQLRQKDIIHFIHNDYNENFERKSISRCISELMDLDYDIVYENGYYLDNRTFDKSELSFLIDMVLNSNVLSHKQARDIINKCLIDESNYLKRSIPKIHNVSRMNYHSNPEFMLNIEIINEAIELNKKISFDYLEYGLDKKLHLKRKRKYIVNPYELVASLNRYYLIGNYDRYDNLSNYRIDKICHVEILDETRKPLSSSIDLPRYSLEHLYMFSGKSVHVKLKFQNHIIDQIIDWFSTECTIQPIDEKYSYLYANVNENALYYWLKQYDEFVERVA